MDRINGRKESTKEKNNIQGPWHISMNESTLDKPGRICRRQGWCRWQMRLKDS